MATVSEITRRQREIQSTIAEELKAGGYTIKALARKSNIPDSTLRSYFPTDGTDPAQMPVSALFMLIGAVPSSLLSLLLPDGWQVLQAPEDVDHDELCRAMEDYLAEKSLAHAVDSPGGREIVEEEDSRLRGKLAVVQAKAG